MSDKYIYIKSYGCQMNVYDSNRIKDLFSNKGYKVTDDISKEIKETMFSLWLSQMVQSSHIEIPKKENETNNL